MFIKNKMFLSIAIMTLFISWAAYDFINQFMDNWILNDGWSLIKHMDRNTAIALSVSVGLMILYAIMLFALADRQAPPDRTALRYAKVIRLKCWLLIAGFIGILSSSPGFYAFDLVAKSNNPAFKILQNAAFYNFLLTYIWLSIALGILLIIFALTIEVYLAPVERQISNIMNNDIHGAKSQMKNKV
jgi:hypothetical protein